METTPLDRKLKTLDQFYQKAFSKEYQSCNTIHKLRIKARELLSCISKEDSFYKELKKLIKLTNEIRDIDVFLNEFLKGIPFKYLETIHKSSLEKKLNRERKSHCENLRKSFKKINFPTTLVSMEKKKKLEKNQLQKPTLGLNQKELHQYRIYIKKRLYFYKLYYPEEKKRIKTLTKIKDHLGRINDNINGEKRLVTLAPKIEKELSKYIEKINKKYLKKVIKLEATLKL